MKTTFLIKFLNEFLSCFCSINFDIPHSCNAPNLIHFILITHANFQSLFLQDSFKSCLASSVSLILSELYLVNLMILCNMITLSEKLYTFHIVTASMCFYIFLSKCFIFGLFIQFKKCTIKLIINLIIIFFNIFYYRQLSAVIKMKKYRIKTSFVSPERLKTCTSKNVINFKLFFYIRGKLSVIRCYI